MKRVWTTIFVLLWVGAVAGGFISLARYAGTPGEAGLTPALLDPVQTAIPIPKGKKSLVAFFHPKCPCSAASFNELERLLARYKVPVSTIFVFTTPSGSREWRESALCRKAEKIPHSLIFFDPDGRESERFGAFTSGHIVMFDEKGNLAYSGGVTGARGHEGINPGAQSVLKLLKGEETDAARFPTFGCPLITP